MTERKPILTLPRKQILGNRSDQAGNGSARAMEMAQPLFDIGLIRFGIHERVRRAKPVSSRLRDLRMLCMLNGTRTWRVGGVTHRVGPGMLFFLPADTRFTRCDESPSLWYIDFRIRETSLWTPMVECGIQVRDYADVDLLYALVTRILSRCSADTTPPSPEAQVQCREDAGILSALLRREILRSEAILHPEPGVSTLPRRILAAPDRNWSVRRIARDLNTSVRTLNRLCRRHHGEPAGRLVIRMRMKKAQELLTRRQASVVSVARAVGYINPASFSEVFLKHVGMRPGAYRKEQLAVEEDS